MAPRRRLTPINNIRPRLSTRILQHLGNNKRQTLREQEAQNPTIHLPQTILPPPWPAQLALAGDRVLRLVVREEAIEEEGVDDYEDEGEEAGDGEGVGYGDAFVDGVGVLEGDVSEGEVLVVGFNGVEDEEADDAGTVGLCQGAVFHRDAEYSHQDHVVENVAAGVSVDLVRHKAAVGKPTRSPRAVAAGAWRTAASPEPPSPEMKLKKQER